MPKSKLSVAALVLWLAWGSGAFLGATVGSSAAGEPGQSGKTIIVGSEVDFAPYAFVDAAGKAGGFSVELIQAVAKTMGLTLDIRPSTWDRAWNGLQQGDVNVLPLVAMIPGREKLVDFTTPHTVTYDAFFTRTGTPEIDSIAAAKGKEVIAMRSDAAAEALTLHGFAGRVVLTDTLSDAMRLLASGKHDAVLAPKLLGLVAIDGNRLSNLAAGPPLKEYQRTFAFAVRQGDDPLRAQLDQGLAIVKATGIYRDIYNRWLGAIESPAPWYGVIPTWVWWCLVTIGLAILAVSARLRLRDIERLRKSEARLRLFFERQIVGMAITSPTKGWLQVNDRLCQMLGYGREELDRLSWAEMTHPDDLAADLAQFENLLAGKIDAYSLEKRFICKDGHIVHTDLSVGCVRKSDGSVDYVLALIVDITERKRAEDALALANRHLAASNAEFQQFAFVASHDLREPLRTITNYLQLLERRYKSRFDAEADEFIDFTIGAAKRMASLIDGLLEFARIESRAKPFAPLSLDAITHEAIGNLDAAIKESGAEISVAALPTVKGDDVQLIQLFQNLIGNGLKYRATDRPLHIAIACRRDGGHWVFSVADNGIGIHPDNFERIFNIFQRLHPREAYEGIGIGLSICKKIVERHGGRIWVRSEPDRGSTFEFTLPVGA